MKTSLLLNASATRHVCGGFWCYGFWSPLMTFAFYIKVSVYLGLVVGMVVRGVVHTIFRGRW
jgi:hypothetical protein